MNLQKLFHIDDRTYQDVKDVLEGFAAAAFIGFIIFVCSLFQSCKVYRDVEVQVRDTLILRDSVKVCDTVTQVRVEREVVENNYFHEKTQDYNFGKLIDELGIRVDTVRIVERIYKDTNTYKEVIDSLTKALYYYKNKDSIANHDESIKEKEVVEKPLTWEQRLLMALGQVFLTLAVAVGVGALAYYLLKKSK